MLQCLRAQLSAIEHESIIHVLKWLFVLMLTMAAAFTQRFLGYVPPQG